MPAAVLLSLVVSASGTPCALKLVDHVAVADREIRIGDVVDLHCLAVDERKRVSGLTIAVLPSGRSQFQLDRTAVKSLVRRRVPGLALPPEAADGQRIVFTAPAPSRQDMTVACHRARRPIRAGAIIVAGDIDSAACESPSAAAGLTFDRTHHITRTTRDIQAGEFLGRLAAPQTAYDASDAVSVTVAIGPVRIERKVEVVQPGIGGQDVFVRDSEGLVFAAPTRAERNGGE